MVICGMEEQKARKEGRECVCAGGRAVAGSVKRTVVEGLTEK